MIGSASAFFVAGSTGGAPKQNNETIACKVRRYWSAAGRDGGWKARRRGRRKGRRAGEAERGDRRRPHRATASQSRGAVSVDRSSDGPNALSPKALTRRSCLPKPSATRRRWRLVAQPRDDVLCAKKRCSGDVECQARESWLDGDSAPPHSAARG
ncbi:hypothetical protein BJY59DRAFT_164441 [Rhodotorula toruloides]